MKKTLKEKRNEFDFKIGFQQIEATQPNGN